MDPGRFVRQLRYRLSVGWLRLWPEFRCRLFGTNASLARRLGAFRGVGLEVGGPSSIFSARGWLPIYPVATRIDNLTFGARIEREGCVQAGETFRFQSLRKPSVCRKLSRSSMTS